MTNNTEEVSPLEVIETEVTNFAEYAKRAKNPTTAQVLNDFVAPTLSGIAAGMLEEFEAIEEDLDEMRTQIVAVQFSLIQVLGVSQWASTAQTLANAVKAKAPPEQIEALADACLGGIAQVNAMLASISANLGESDEEPEGEDGEKDASVAPESSSENGANTTAAVS